METLATENKQLIELNEQLTREKKELENRLSKSFKREEGYKKEISRLQKQLHKSQATELNLNSEIARLNDERNKMNLASNKQIEKLSNKINELEGDK